MAREQADRNKGGTAEEQQNTARGGQPAMKRAPAKRDAE
jgi:hypothetical protein